MRVIEISDGVVHVDGAVVGRVERAGAHKRCWLFTDLAGRERFANNHTALERRIIEAADAAKEGS